MYISSYPPFPIPKLQTNHNYCADQVLSVSTSAYALIHRFGSWSAGRWIAVWQLGNFDKSLQDRNLYLRWRWGDCCFTSNPTEGPTSCTAVINREFCLRNFRLRYWRLHEVRSSNCGKITDSFFCLCLLMLFPCTRWLTIKDSPDKCDTSFGVIFQMGDNSVNLICLYKSLEIMMINIHFTVNRLFLLDTRLCWNKWKITVV